MDLRTSITIVPPHSVQAVAVPLLRRYAYDLPRRLPAHVTGLYPFVPVDELEAACETLRELCQHVPPFDLTVSGYGAFTGVAYLDVTPSPALDALRARLQQGFPGCVPYDGAFGADGPPTHITVGVFSTRAKQQRAELPPYEPLTFTVDRLHVSVGVEPQILPWLTRDVVRLGG